MTRWAFDHERPPALDVDIAFRGDAHELRKVWEQTLKARIPAHYAELLPIITDWLHEAFSYGGVTHLDGCHKLFLK